MIDWKTGRLIVFILLLLGVVVTAGLVGSWQQATEDSSQRQDVPFWVDFLDWWRREPVLEPEIVARPVKLPMYPVVVPPVNPVPPFVPRPEVLVPDDPSFLERVDGLVYCPSESAGSPSPWCA